MAGPADYDEMTAASLAFQMALAKIGAASVARTIQIWRRHAGSAADADRAMNLYLDEIVRTAGPQRQLAQDMALAYYRLVRALDTGFTLPPMKPDGRGSTTLHDLRTEFAALTETAGVTFKVQPRQPGKSGTPVIYIKDVTGSDIEKIANAEAARGEATLRAKATAGGRRRVERETAKHDPEKITAKQMDEIRKESERKAEAVQATAVATYLKDSGRRFIDHLTQSDPGCEGWIRVPQGEYTCAFCMMLCSRGPVYFSKKTAGDGDYVGASGDPAYHDNCDCITVPVFTNSDWWDHPLFAENRRLQDLWADKIAGGNSKDALYRWRRLLEGRAKGKAITRTPRKTAEEQRAKRQRRRRSR